MAFVDALDTHHANYSRQYARILGEFDEIDYESIPTARLARLANYGRVVAILNYRLHGDVRDFRQRMGESIRFTIGLLERHSDGEPISDCYLGCFFIRKSTLPWPLEIFVWRNDLPLC